eukprot:TRINITY_DN8016_c0_g1_i1.p1 TRINITY_DN8016_c0_g1~~TRINITY_DN8016_c0_g1_i1.p1  ORF type:complete len:1688 (-),score=287.75 TRINITY_DN8016_c0_g1_i1:156-5219(-)
MAAKAASKSLKRSKSGVNASVQVQGEACASCSSTFVEGSNFCNKCGVPRRASQRPVVCGRCDNVFVEDANFCRKCGAPRQATGNSSAAKGNAEESYEPLFSHPEMKAVCTRFKAAIELVYTDFKTFVRAADDDLNGEIDFSELRQRVYELKMACRKKRRGATQPLTDSDIAIVMKALDQDGNGSVSLEEFEALLETGERKKKQKEVEAEEEEQADEAQQDEEKEKQKQEMQEALKGKAKEEDGWKGIVEHLCEPVEEEKKNADTTQQSEANAASGDKTESAACPEDLSPAVENNMCSDRRRVAAKWVEELNESLKDVCNLDFFWCSVDQVQPNKEMKAGEEGHLKAEIAEKAVRFGQILRKDVVRWSKWSFYEVDFTKFAFLYSEFTDCSFIKCKFACLIGCKIKDCYFDDCQFIHDSYPTGGDVLYAMKGGLCLLERVRFKSCEFKSAVFPRATDCVFATCTFHDTWSKRKSFNFHFTELELSGQHKQKPVFSICRFVGCSFGCVVDFFIELKDRCKFTRCTFTQKPPTEPDTKEDLTLVPNPTIKCSDFNSAVFLACNFLGTWVLRLCPLEDCGFDRCTFTHRCQPKGGAVHYDVNADLCPPARLEHVKFTTCQFMAAILPGAEHCEFDRCTFHSRCDNDDGTVHVSSLVNVKFSTCDFTAAVFPQADKCKFSKCRFLKFATFPDQDEPSIEECDFKHCYFQAAETKVDYPHGGDCSSTFLSCHWKTLLFYDCNFSHVRFDTAQLGAQPGGQPGGQPGWQPCFLDHVTFDDCTLDDVTLAKTESKTEWAGVFIKGGTMKGAKGISEVQIVAQRGDEGHPPGQYPRLLCREKKRKKSGTNGEMLQELRRVVEQTARQLISTFGFCCAHLNPASWLAKRMEGLDAIHNKSETSKSASKEATDWLLEEGTEVRSDEEDETAAAGSTNIRATRVLKQAKNKKKPTDKRDGMQTLLQEILRGLEALAASQEAMGEAQAQLLRAMSRLFMTHIETAHDDKWCVDVAGSLDKLQESMRDIPNVKGHYLGEVLLQMWKMRQVPTQVSRHENDITGMAVSPDGKEVVTASGCGEHAVLRFFKCRDLKKNRKDVLVLDEGCFITHLIWLKKDTDPEKDTKHRGSVQSDATENHGLLKHGAIESPWALLPGYLRSSAPADKSVIIIAGCSDHKLRVIRTSALASAGAPKAPEHLQPLNTQELDLSFPIGFMAWTPAWVADGDFIIVHGPKKTLRLIKVDYLLNMQEDTSWRISKELQEIDTESQVQCVTWVSADTFLVALAAKGYYDAGSEVAVYRRRGKSAAPYQEPQKWEDTKAGKKNNKKQKDCDFKEIARFKTRLNVNCMAVSPKEDTVAMAGRKKYVLAIYNIQDMRSEEALAQHPEVLSSIAYSKDGRSIVTGCNDGSVRILHPEQITSDTKSNERKLRKRREFALPDVDVIQSAAYGGESHVMVAGGSTLRSFQLPSNPEDDKADKSLNDLALQKLAHLCDRFYILSTADTHSGVKLDNPVISFWSSLTKSPFETTRDVAELERLLEKLQKLETEAAEKWDELSHAWGLLYGDHAASKSHYVQTVLERLFDTKLRTAIGFARFCQDCKLTVTECPADVVEQLRLAKKLLKANIEAYVIVIKQEIDKLNQFLELKTRVVGFVGVGLIGLSTACGNLLADRIRMVSGFDSYANNPVMIYANATTALGSVRL